MPGEGRKGGTAGVEKTLSEKYVFVLMSFEGNDPYSQAGGLGVRAFNLGEALALKGVETHLFFIGDPELPGEEALRDGRFVLHRWGQWISRHHPNGVYDGEDGKAADYARSVPPYIVERIARKAAAEGKRLVAIAEEWQTAEALMHLSDLLHRNGLRPMATLLWNANNTMSFHRINWGRLSYVAHILAVSKFMKHTLWGHGVNPIVTPNGIPERLTLPLDPEKLKKMSGGLKARGPGITMFKIGRFDPAKRWTMAVEAAARLKERGRKPLLIARGGIEPHGAEVFRLAAGRGLRIQDVKLSGRPTVDEAIDAVRNAPAADVLNLRFFLPEEFVSVMYACVDCVLANSGFEPFGLVGLEVMASKGVAFTGATGEEYVESFNNGISIETEDPEEIVAYLDLMKANPAMATKMREQAHQTAKRYVWPLVIDNLIARIEFLSRI